MHLTTSTSYLAMATLALAATCRVNGAPTEREQLLKSLNQSHNQFLQQQANVSQSPSMSSMAQMQMQMQPHHHQQYHYQYQQHPPYHHQHQLHSQHFKHADSANSYHQKTTEFNADNARADFQLHFGAKLALVLLLVASATYVDLRSQNSKQSQMNRNDPHNNYHNSLSSSTSSSLLCGSSATSVASASAPILSMSSKQKANNKHGTISCTALIRHLFLAFSLRHSAALIFADHFEKGADKSCQWESESGPADHQLVNNNNNNNNRQQESIDSLHGLRFFSMIWIIVVHSYSLATRWSFFAAGSNLENMYKTAASQLLSNGTFACDSFFFTGGFLLAYLAFPASFKQSSKEEEERAKQQVLEEEPRSHSPTITTPSRPIINAIQLSRHLHTNCQGEREKREGKGGGEEFTLRRVFENLVHRYVRMMPLMMAIIGLSATLLRYLGEGPSWDNSTIMFDNWCRSNWWINALFLHNFLNTENMCLSHSWYSAVDIQLFFIGQLILFILFRSRRFGILICCIFLLVAPITTATLTLLHHLPAVPLMIDSVSEQSLNLYYGQVYIKPYCRASPYLIGILLAYLMRTTWLGQVRLKRWQIASGWTTSIGMFVAILMAMQPAMNGQPPSEVESALYSALSRPFWACATGWMIFACITKQGGIFQSILSARCFVPLSRLTYPAFLIHPIIMALFYGSRQERANFSHYLMLYLILGHIVITYASAFLLSALFELPILSAERTIKHALMKLQ